MVYFISNESNKIKIGFTKKDPEERLSSLQTASAEKLTAQLVIDGDMDKEKSLHLKFASANIRGEWFRWNDEIKSFMRDHGWSHTSAATARTEEDAGHNVDADGEYVGGCWSWWGHWLSCFIVDNDIDIEQDHCARCMDSDDDDCTCSRDEKIEIVSRSLYASNCEDHLEIINSYHADFDKGIIYLVADGDWVDLIDTADAVMRVLDCDAEWTVLMRSKDGDPDRWFTTDREVYRPGRYVPPPERRVRAAQEKLRRAIEAERRNNG